MSLYTVTLHVEVTQGKGLLSFAEGYLNREPKTEAEAIDVALCRANEGLLQVFGVEIVNRSIKKIRG